MKARGLSEATVFGERGDSWKRSRPAQREGGKRWKIAKRTVLGDDMTT